MNESFPFRSIARDGLVLALAAGWGAAPALAQESSFGLRFHGTGANQQDRVRVLVDDDAPGPNASAPCDVGAGDFTLGFWLRGTLADNPTAHLGGDQLVPGDAWRLGNALVDRDILGVSERDFGVSVAGGFVRFGVGRGESTTEVTTTIEGDVDVLDDAWHHVACVRDAASGVLSIYVDGALDFESPTGTSTADVSYPDDGLPSHNSAWDPYLVFGAEKHDSGPQYPSFTGYFDEVRIWDVALSSAELANTWFLLLPGDFPGIVANYRFEEGTGTTVSDASEAGSPDGELIAGVPQNGEWVSAADHTANTARLIASPLPPGFDVTTIANDLVYPTTMAVAPDGRVFVGRLDGLVLVVENGVVLSNPLVQVPTTSMGERGLLGLAVDPDFANNGFLYAYYSNDDPRNRVTCFTVVGNSASPSSEFLVWENTEPCHADAHHGGALAFDADGCLYISTGDLGDSANSQNLANEHGKVLRVMPDGSIPPDNPHVGNSNAVPTIWARGLRNPFRMSVDAVEHTLWIGDVGGNGGSHWEEVNLGGIGANYGWPSQEAANCFTSNCSSFTQPEFAYRHNDPDFQWDTNNAALIVGPVYRHTAFPPEFRGNLYIGDYANRWIKRLEVVDHELGYPVPFMQAPDAGSIVEIAVGAAGEMYFLTYGSPSGIPDDPVGGLYRIDYSIGGNLPPVVVATADPTSGLPPLDVQFSSDGTFDPDGPPTSLTYLWDFGDGGQSTDEDPLHTYVVAGPHVATLDVHDSAGSSISDPIAVTVGNPPVPTIDLPLAGAQYRAGDVIDFAGGATDVEDGVLPPSALSWEVRFVHGNHAHPYLGPIVGVDQGSFAIPTTGHLPEDTHYRVGLVATDSDGLASAATADIFPVPAVVSISTRPAGIPVFVGGQAEGTPRDYTSLPNFVLELEAPRSAIVEQELWLFCCWTDGGDRAHAYVTPAGDSALQAVYAPAIEHVKELEPPAQERNAQYDPVNGQAYADQGDPLALCLGREPGVPHEVGLEFNGAIPPGALVLSATLHLVAASDQHGDMVAADIWAFDVSDPPPFVAGDQTPIRLWAPLTDATVRWRPIPAFSPGLVYASPELADLVQEVVDRPDWTMNSVLGLVLDGKPTEGTGWRCMWNFDSGTPPILRVQYAVPVRHR